MKSTVIYGPPGCGKTTDLVRRIPSEKPTCVISHTKTAATVLAKRAGLEDNEYVSTMHALAFRLIMAAKAQMIDKAKLRQFGALIGMPTGSEYDDREGDYYLTIYKLSRILGITPLESWNRTQHKTGSYQKYEYVCARYQAWKGKSGYLDFEDLLLLAMTAPAPGVRRIIIDEGQDFGPLQWRLLFHWLEVGNIEEVVIAGDDDQCVFKWNGAAPEGMVNFERIHDAERVILSQSFRVPRKIHRLALRVISRASNRVDKQYMPRDAEGVVNMYGSVNALALGDSPTMIVYRNHSLRKPVENDLITRGVPYTAATGTPGYFDGTWANRVRLWRSYDSLNVRQRDRLVKHVPQKWKQAVSEGRPVPVHWANVFYAMPQRVKSYLLAVDLDTKPLVTLSTIHASKGEESPRVVFYNGMSARTLQHYTYDPESEVRVAYVAVTRAIERLDIVNGPNTVRWGW